MAGPGARATTEVFVVGALHLDVVVDAPHLPALDETVMGQAVAYRFGGKGGNQAVAAARMGAQVAMAGRVGPDGFGAAILAALDQASIDRHQVRRVPGASGMSVAIVEAGGEYGAVVVSGVNRDIAADEIDLPESGLLLLQNEIPEAVNLALAHRAGPATRLVLNAAPARAMGTDLLARTDLLVANRVEAAALSGQPPETLDAQAACDSLLALGPAAAIVTLGAGGLVGGTRDGLRFARAAHSVDVISTHGAGDMFVGALAAELSRGAALPDAAAFANGAGALAVATPPDARDGLSIADVRALAAQAPTSSP